MDPQRGVYPWDYRRGMLTARALKRMSEYSPTDEFVYPGTESYPPKRPRNDVPTLEGEEPGPEQTAQGVLRSLLEEQEETEDPPSVREEASPRQQQLVVQLELQRQRLRQRKLQEGIRLMFEQLVKTQQGAHLDPRLL